VNVTVTPDLAVPIAAGKTGPVFEIWNLQPSPPPSHFIKSCLFSGWM
jgi:hypothetical protein